MSPDGDDAPSSEDDDVVRLRIPTALQTVMALDIAVAMLCLTFAVLLAVTAYDGWLGRVSTLLIAVAVYAASGLWISVQLGRASQAARVAQVIWSGLQIACVVWTFDAGMADPEAVPGLLVGVFSFMGLAPVLSLVLLFTPSVRSFFRTVQRGELPAS